MADPVEEIVDRGDDFTPVPEEIPALGAEFDPETLKAIAGGIVEPTDAEPAAAATEPPDTDGPMIPKARFDEVNAKAKQAAELAAENERLKALLEGKGTPASDTPGESAPPDPTETLKTKLKETRAAAREALLDNRLDDYDELMLEADNLNQDIAEARIRASLKTEKVQDDTQRAMQAAAAKAYEVYPFLNVADEAGRNDDAIEAVVALRNNYISQGLSPVAALEKAVGKIGPLYATTPAPAGETAEAKRVREERETAARKKAAEASIAQPPAGAPSSKETSFKVDVTKLSDAEFAALPASVKAKLRGDTM